jgi:carotenoid cleavage dioxygenase-like enzyme
MIVGSIPTWLEGSLYRNGPGLFEIGDSHFRHLFDGQAKIHKFSIRNGRVNYQSRFVHSENYKRNMVAQRIVVSEFGTLAVPDPCKNIFQRYMC